MENLNAEQIKKALECCTRGRKSNEDIPCLECPYNECNIVGGTSERQIKGTCQGWLMKDALALIKTQEQRIGAQDMTISELRQRAEKAEHDADRYAQKIKELTKENERLRQYEITYETPSGKQTMPNLLSLDGDAAELYKRIEDKVKVDTVRKYNEKVYQLIIRGFVGDKLSEQDEYYIMSRLGQIANELLTEDQK